MKLLIALALLGCLAAASAQPFEFNGTFNPQKGEAAQREQLNYTGFVFDFRHAKKTDGGTPNGDLRSNQVSQNPFLSTLPYGGNGQTLVTMGPCAGNTVHSHPRGSEIAFMVYGEVLFGMIDENTPDGNSIHNRLISTGETIHIPTALIHYSHNPTCGNAQFLSSFATLDPGTQTTWNSFIQVPSAVLQLSTGIPESTFAELKKMPLVIAPGTGGEACLKRCGLDFYKANAFEATTADGTVVNMTNANAPQHNAGR